KEVTQVVVDCLKNYCANAGRGGHKMSIKTAEEITLCREQLATFFGVKNPLRFCFTKNTTESLNIGIKGVLKSGDHVITTHAEHNSVIRPLKELERDGIISLTIVDVDNAGVVTADNISKAMQLNTKLVVLNHANNVTGCVNPIFDIGKMVRQKGVLMMVDAAQTAGCLAISLEHIDLLAFPGHKSLLAPQGVGVLYVRPGVVLKPLMSGGTGTESKNLYQPIEYPEFLESGTLNAPAIVGLRAGVNYIAQMGTEKVHAQEMQLFKRAFDGLKSIPNVIVYGHDNVQNHVGVISFNIRYKDCVEVASQLSTSYNIALRAGYHCNYLAHQAIGTGDIGTVRVSFNTMNQMHQLDHFLMAVNQLALRPH
ncbi:MAG: aminotransferase class V-fold PLP-dependent enzyme, partial [Hyphomonadaceae bacterium]|nr:aminotransferase class V-fold PLP-dependent enzyme [Clostridia bacterium]